MIHKFNFIERILLSNDVIAHPFFDAAINAGLSKALGTAVKLGLTQKLTPEYQSAEVLAQNTDLSLKGTSLLLNCLEALGYVDRSEQGFRMSKRGLKHLDPNSPNSFHHFILFGDWIYRSFTELESSVQKGAPQQHYHETYTQEDWHIYGQAMKEIARNTLPEILKKVKPRSGAQKLLDLGGSHGLCSIEFCKKFPSLEATIMDVAEVEELATQVVAEHGMQQQVQFQVGNFMEDELPTGNDLVLLFNIIHIFSPEENQKLLQRIHQALNPGGQIIIFDQIHGVGSQSQMARGMTTYMALNLFHQTGGNVYPFEEVKAWANATNYASCKINGMNVPGFGMITITK